MTISILDSDTISPADTNSSIVIRLNNEHALAIMGRYAAVVDITGSSLTIGTSSDYDTGSDTPGAAIVDATAYKVGIAYCLPTRYLRAAIIDADISTDSFTSNNALLRDSFVENPTYYLIQFGGCVVASGTDLQVFWMESDTSATDQFWQMTVDCSGSTPSPGTPSKWTEESISTYGVPIAAILFGSSGILVTNTGYYTTFTFGGNPSASWSSISGISSVIPQTPALFGSSAFLSDGSQNGIWVTSSSMTDVSPPAILTTCQVAYIEAGAALSANGQYLERIKFSGSTISSVDNNFEYCAACATSQPAGLVCMLSNNSQALILRRNDIYLIGNIPLEGGGPPSNPARLYWGLSSVPYSVPIEVT